MGVLLSVVHLLLEGFGFLFIDKTKASQAIFEFEGMEENSILVIRESVVDLLVPEYTAVGGLYPVSYRLTPMPKILTEISTSLIQNVFPTKSLARTAAPCSPV